MKRITKARLDISLKAVVELPMGAQVLSVQAGQGAEWGLWLWFAGDPNAKKENRTFAVIRDGSDDDVTSVTYIGMAVMGTVVFHVFEVKK